MRPLAIPDTTTALKTLEVERLDSTPEMGLMDLVKGRRASAAGNQKRASHRRLTESRDHEDGQVLDFRQTVRGDGAEPDMTRELLSVPKSSRIESMVDHLQTHENGDIFPYVSVVGNEEEGKESRLARLRAYRSPYGKENKPEMRINGIMLTETEGMIRVQDLKDYVNKSQLSPLQKKENKKFKSIDGSNFVKPYIQISRITGEFVPLMSSTTDYTDLYFTLEDGRLLDKQVVVQSGKLPTNQNGVFELSCDYCVNSKDIEQVSLKYFLARPIMKEGYQWGSVSLTIRVSESDTPYLMPKVEAMAVVRMPFTTLEEQKKNPDHADVVFTSHQITKFREMYKSGDIADIDEAKASRMQVSSYSKSSFRGVVKSQADETGAASRPGWEHLQGARKPLLPEGEASVSAESDNEDEDLPSGNDFTRAAYEAHQAELREQFRTSSGSTEDIDPDRLTRSPSPSAKPLKSAMKKSVRLSEPLKPPNTDSVFEFN